MASKTVMAERTFTRSLVNEKVAFPIYNAGADEYDDDADKMCKRMGARMRAHRTIPGAPVPFLRSCSFSIPS